MRGIAKSSIAPIIGQRVPLRGPARLLYHSYAKAPCYPSDSIRRLTTKFGDSFDADLSSSLEWQLWAFGSYEEHFAELFRYLVHPGDRCVDVGANVGIHTIRLAKLVGAQGKVIALEPDEELAGRATNNIALNSLTNVQVIQAAASESGCDAAVLYRPDTRDSNKGRASLLPHSYLTGSQVTVPTVAIDDINRNPVNLIKIDVEGFEAAVVSGATNTIQAYSPSIIFEYAPKLLVGNSGSPFRWLQERNYEMYSIRLKRHGLTGRSTLRLEHSPELPEKGANILAIPTSTSLDVSSLVR